ncbi:molybdate ABC transporter substrate-binding protein [Sulfitobacter aestuariivivens]|uniref:molybdate ABC transporter substrate-binding protein n=1 Tax=Sulfitobacter aestuariivivens TaxID=2766981 RepID=UPI00361709D3
MTVFAAASLQGALEEIAASYITPVTHSFAGSGTIARQIAAGAPADVVVLASPDWMDWVSDNAPETPLKTANIAGNTLVVVAQAGASPLSDVTQIASRLADGRLAMGHRDAVPAGRYAREWLQSTGQWTLLQDRLAETDNVRAALALVAKAEAPLGIVYATDAQAEARVEDVLTIPTAGHSPIRYPAAALTPAGLDYLSHLQSDAARDILARHGFSKGTP